MEVTIYSVYWIHLEEHVNKLNEGYIGVTCNTDRRWKEHLTKARSDNNLHLYNAIRKHGEENVVFEVVHSELTEQEAYDLENVYRPSKDMGWNMAIGGSLSVANTSAVEVKLFRIDDIHNTLTFRSIAKAERALNYTVGTLSTRHYRGRQYIDSKGIVLITDETLSREHTPTISSILSKTHLGMKRKSPSHFKGITNRWTKEQKEAISKVHKGKVISEKQIKQTILNNRLKHPTCSPISLVHKNNPTVTCSYHSISEASRQLNLPLPRLKSKVQRPLNVYGKDGWKVIAYKSNKAKVIH